MNPRRGRLVKRPKSRTSVPRGPNRNTFIQLATYSTSALGTSAGGALSYEYQPNDFGLGAGATYLLFSPQLVLGATFGSEYRIRIRRMELHYLPFFGRSIALGSGSGVAAITRTQTAPGPVLTYFASCQHHQFIYAGKPHTLRWVPKEMPDTLWVSSKVAQASLLPVDDTTVGCSMVAQFIGCAASTNICQIEFVFALEVERF
jgi:hypothetical protein